MSNVFIFWVEINLMLIGNAFAKDAHSRPPDLVEMKNATSIPRTERKQAGAEQCQA